MDRQIGLYIMGGTIDSRNAPERDGETVVLSESLVRRYLESLRINAQFHVYEICMKDSRGVTSEDREELLRKINEAGLRENLVTHGTYTMRKTAAFLNHNELELPNKAVVVTGAMGTLLGTVNDRGHLAPSDGQFNLGYSIGALPYLDDGVYQSMNGEIFKLPDEWWQHTIEGVEFCKNGKTTKIFHG